MGKKLADLHFSNRLYKTNPFLFEKVAPTPLLNPQINHVNFSLLGQLELDESLVSNPSFLRFINGDLDFEGLFFGASFYSGHQFGHYVPRLGDGRAICLGEVKTSEDQYFELQLKGSGLTPFSRMGDGKAVIRSSIREYLASAHLKAMGVPTTEALSVISGSDDVYRETIEKSAIVLRVAESFLRFGHFQYYAHTGQTDELLRLIEFVINHYYPKLKDHPNRHFLLFQEIVKRTAKLFAKWQSVGFCHGVLNTDNMSILGLTLDYGPYGFIDTFDPGHICNHSDYEGRYSFGNQPGIGMWNLQKLAEALGAFISTDDLERTLETYPAIFLYEYRRELLVKCGLYQLQADDEEFLKTLLSMLAETKVDYTQFFRSLSRYKVKSGNLSGICSSRALSEWLQHYEFRLQKEELSEGERISRMLQTNPKYILRNYLAQEAIDNPALLDIIFKLVTRPYDEWDEFEAYSRPAPEKYKNLFVSCSS